MPKSNGHKPVETHINVPGYSGVERRAFPCGFHSEHKRILEDHDSSFDKIDTMIKEEITKMEDRRRSMWDAIKTKASNKFLVIFITTYTTIFATGIGTLFFWNSSNNKEIADKITSNNLAITEKISEMNIKLNGATIHLEYQKIMLNDMNEKIDDHISKTKNGHK